MAGPLGRAYVHPCNDPHFVDTLRGVLYRMVWERKNQPSPGAQAYAWETYALPAFTPIGAGTHAISRRLHAFYSPPSWANQVTVIAGIPRIAGQYILQPLLDPYGTNSGHP